jgi:hypothetical protein
MSEGLTLQRVSVADACASAAGTSSVYLAGDGVYAVYVSTHPTKEER